MTAERTLPPPVSLSAGIAVRHEAIWETSARYLSPESAIFSKSDHFYESIAAGAPTLDEDKLLCRRRFGDDRLAVAFRMDRDADILVRAPPYRSRPGRTRHRVVTFRFSKVPIP